MDMKHMMLPAGTTVPQVVSLRVIQVPETLSRIVGGFTSIPKIPNIVLVDGESLIADAMGSLGVYTGISDVDSFQVRTLTITATGTAVPINVGNVATHADLPTNVSGFPDRTPIVGDYARVQADETLAGSPTVEWYITDIDGSGNITWGNHLILNTDDYQAQTSAADAGKVPVIGTAEGTWGTSRAIDTTPQVDSTNLITSGSVFAALAAKANQSALNNYLLLSGGALTGPIGITGSDSTVRLRNATTYLSGTAAGLILRSSENHFEFHNNTDALMAYLNATDLYVQGIGILAALNQRAMSTDLNKYLPLNGGTMTGITIFTSSGVRYFSISGNAATGEAYSYIGSPTTPQTPYVFMGYNTSGSFYRYAEIRSDHIFINSDNTPVTDNSKRAATTAFVKSVVSEYLSLTSGGTVNGNIRTTNGAYLLNTSATDGTLRVNLFGQNSDTRQNFGFGVVNSDDMNVRSWRDIYFETRNRNQATLINVVRIAPGELYIYDEDGANPIGVRTELSKKATLTVTTTDPGEGVPMQPGQIIAVVEA